MSEPTITLEVTRYRPGRDSKPTFQDYQIPYREDWVVLDALNYIKDYVDGTLSFRWSCRMGVCGSCGMMVNRSGRLTCASFLRDYYPKPIRVEPMDHFPIIRDLVVDMNDFLDKLKNVKPWIIREQKKRLEEGEYLQTPAEKTRYEQYSQCINCMLCYAVCPVYGNDKAFLGPAAIALAQRYNLDSRDEGRLKREEVVAAPEGAWMCTFVGECTRVCPKDVDPAGAIQRAKLASARDWWKSLLLPWGKSQ